MTLQVSFFKSLPTHLASLRQGLTLGLEFTSSLGWLLSKLQGLCPFLPPQHRHYKHMPAHPDDF